MVKNCDRGLENAARGPRPRAAFSSPRSQFFTIRTDPKPANNMFTSFLVLQIANGFFYATLVIREFKQIVTTGSDTAAGSKFPPK